jgi:hypothetical protein
MARKTILVSDLTGEEISERDAATVTIRYSDARRGQVVLDVNASEVEDLAAKGQRQARRGRRPAGAQPDRASEKPLEGQRSGTWTRLSVPH